MKNYYYILGVKKDSTIEEIEQAYKSLNQKFNVEIKSSDTFFINYLKEIKEAFEVLKNADQRREHDRMLKYSEIQDDRVALYKSERDKAKQDFEQHRVRETEELQKKEEKLKNRELELQVRQQEFNAQKSIWTNDAALYKKDYQDKLEAFEIERQQNQQLIKENKGSTDERWLSRKWIIAIISAVTLIIVVSGAIYLYHKTDPPIQTEIEIPAEPEIIVLDTVVQDSETTVQTETDNNLDTSFIAARMDTILNLYEEITKLEMTLTKNQTSCGFVSVRAKNGEVKIIGRSFTSQSTGLELSQNFFFDNGELIYVFESYLNEVGNKDQNRFYFQDSKLINTISTEGHDSNNESSEEQMINISNSILRDFNEGVDLKDPECD
ncbi:DnaJ domain-containing protein [Salibacteraceae bacterium]|nr:DnaJ domain-containing protein [Salibacteraceae bacterium]